MSNHAFKKLKQTQRNSDTYETRKDLLIEAIFVALKRRFPDADYWTEKGQYDNISEPSDLPVVIRDMSRVGDGWSRRKTGKLKVEVGNYFNAVDTVHFYEKKNRITDRFEDIVTATHEAAQADVRERRRRDQRSDNYARTNAFEEQWKKIADRNDYSSYGYGLGIETTSQHATVQITSKNIDIGDPDAIDFDALESKFKQLEKLQDEIEEIISNS